MATLRRKLILLIGDVLLLYASLACALLLRQWELVPLGFLLDHFAAFSKLFPLWIAVFHILDLYEPRKAYDLIALLGDLAFALTVNLGFSVAAFYLFAFHLGMTPKTNLFMTVILSHAAILGWRRLAASELLPKLPAARVAFWGDDVLSKEIAEDLGRNPHWGYLPVPLPRLPAAGAAAPAERYWPGRERGGLALKDQVDQIVVDPDRIAAEPAAWQAVVSSAIMEEIPIKTHLDFFEELYAQVPPPYAAEADWLLSNVLPQRNRVYLLLKRALDVAASALGLALVAPLLALIALISKLAEGGSPIYTQARVGYHGKEFKIWKFRTMVPGAESQGPLYRAEKEDSRVTPFGGFLRRFRLDELPQLWNVLKGEMSLVGPRPEWVPETRILEETVPHYHLRHLVMPGITGWAQVNFRATSSQDESLEKLHYDLYYVKNMSLAMDLGILFKTAKRVLLREESFASRRHSARKAAPRPSRRAAAQALALLFLTALPGQASLFSRPDQALTRFPVGIYEVYDPAHLKELREAGFDSFYTEAQGDALESLAREAKRRKMRLLALPQALSQRPAAELRKWPVDAWHLQDEPDVHGIAPEVLEESSRRTRALDPLRPQSLVIGQGAPAQRYGRIGDILMLDWYPVPHLKLDSVADEIDVALRHLPPGKPLWMVIQAMDWKDYPQTQARRVGRFPDFSEMRFMSYLAVLHGARGLFFFSFTKPSGKTLLDVPEEWQAVARVARELALIKPVFEKGAAASLPFPPNPDGLEARAWRFRGRDYVVILNRKGGVMKRFPEELLEREWRPLFEPRRDPRELLKQVGKSWYLPPYRVLVLESGRRWLKPKARTW